MYLFNVNDGCHEMFTLLPTDRFDLRTAYDPFGEIGIELHINEDSYVLITGSVLTDEYPDLDGESVAEFFNAILGETFEAIKAGERCIDFSEIRNGVLSRFRKRWQEDGLIH